MFREFRFIIIFGFILIRLLVDLSVWLTTMITLITNIIKLPIKILFEHILLDSINIWAKSIFFKLF